MKKKLGLLLAMLHQPKLLVLDEPTNGLDVESIYLFYDLIAEKATAGHHRSVFHAPDGPRHQAVLPCGHHQ